MEHIARDYLIDRWGQEIAEDIKPLEIQRWFKSLNSESKLAWTTIAKMRGVMSRIYKVGILHERVTKNPVLHVETRCKTNYRAIVLTPTQTFNHSEIPDQQSSSHACPNLCRDSTPFIRNSRAPLGRHLVARRTDPGFETMG